MKLRTNSAGDSPHLPESRSAPFLALMPSGAYPRQTMTSRTNSRMIVRTFGRSTSLSSREAADLYFEEGDFLANPPERAGVKATIERAQKRTGHCPRVRKTRTGGTDLRPHTTDKRQVRFSFPCSNTRRQFTLRSTSLTQRRRQRRFPLFPNPTHTHQLENVELCDLGPVHRDVQHA